MALRSRHLKALCPPGSIFFYYYYYFLNWPFLNSRQQFTFELIIRKERYAGIVALKMFNKIHMGSKMFISSLSGYECHGNIRCSIIARSSFVFLGMNDYRLHNINLTIKLFFSEINTELYLLPLILPTCQGQGLLISN